MPAPVEAGKNPRQRSDEVQMTLRTRVTSQRPDPFEALAEHSAHGRLTTGMTQKATKSTEARQPILARNKRRAPMASAR